MLERLLLLLSILPTIHGQWDNDICVVRSRDGHSNERETISQDHCAYYDRLHHNGQDTLQVIDLDGTIAGCWLYETETDETFYYNTNLNPSGMCASPHYCVQYTDCIAEGGTLPDNYEAMYLAPTPVPTTGSPTSNEEGIDIASALYTDAPTSSPTREPPSFPRYTILLVSCITLIVFGSIFGFLSIRTTAKADVVYPVV